MDYEWLKSEDKKVSKLACIGSRNFDYELKPKLWPFTTYSEGHYYNEVLWEVDVVWVNNFLRVFLLFMVALLAPSKVEPHEEVT